MPIERCAICGRHLLKGQCPRACTQPLPLNNPIAKSRGLRGGARIGAGRKPVEHKASTACITITPELLERLDTYAHAQNLTRSSAVAQLLERML